MVQLNLPTYPVDLRKIDGKIHIFDANRKKYLVLTPEEWVRQHFLQFLMNQKAYPGSLIKLESGIKYNRQQKRTDLIAHNNKMQPVLLVECKAPQVKINDKTFQQIATYNSEIKAKYLVITNGLEHYCFHVVGKEIVFLEEVPTYEST